MSEVVATPTPVATPQISDAPCVGTDTTKIKINMDATAHFLGGFISKRLRLVIQGAARNSLSQKQLRALSRKLNNASVKAHTLADAAWTTSWTSYPTQLRFCPSDPKCITNLASRGAATYKKQVDEIYALGNDLIKNTYRKLPGVTKSAKINAEFDRLYADSMKALQVLTDTIKTVQPTEQAMILCN